jgi:sRNA-binding protein
MSNERLNKKRIENVSKSGLGREQIDLGIDFDTSFKDIQYLRTEISDFLSRKENSRDFRPYLEIRVNSIQDMQKIQIQCSFWHKSNWSNEQLRAARSSKFLCELIRAVRKIPISKPGGSRAKSGEEGRPSYVVTVSEEEAAAKRAAEKKRQQEKRMDHKPPVLTEEDQSKTERETATANTATAAPKESNQDDEEDALEQLTVIPLAEEVGIPVAGSDNPDGLRQRAPYLFRTGSDQMGMRNVGGPVYSPPFYPPPR